MDEELNSYQRIEKESGEINWNELQPHFARGVVIHIDKDQDLISIAEEFINDNSRVVEQLLQANKITRVSDNTARQWAQSNPLMKTVVIAPWVLIQELNIS